MYIERINNKKCEDLNILNQIIPSFEANETASSSGLNLIYAFLVPWGVTKVLTALGLTL